MTQNQYEKLSKMSIQELLTEGNKIALMSLIAAMRDTTITPKDRIVAISQFLLLYGNVNQD